MSKTKKLYETILVSGVKPPCFNDPEFTKDDIDVSYCAKICSTCVHIKECQEAGDEQVAGFWGKLVNPLLMCETCLGVPKTLTRCGDPCVGCGVILVRSKHTVQIVDDELISRKDLKPLGSAFNCVNCTKNKDYGVYNGN